MVDEENRDVYLCPQTPSREDLIFIEGKYELFWKHMVEEKTFFGCECWTDGEVIGVRKDNASAIEYIIQCVEGKVVSGWKNN